MEHAFFYTWSTIAQALAGAVALLGAFVLFKLQSLDAELMEHAREVIAPLPYDPAGQVSWDHYVRGHWQALLLTLPAHYPFPEIAQMRVTRLRVLVEERQALVHALRVAIFLTLGTMVGAVGVFALVPASWSPWVARIGAGAFAVCIGSYWPVIRRLPK
jgi:hypothetical protein